MKISKGNLTRLSIPLGTILLAIAITACQPATQQASSTKEATVEPLSTSLPTNDAAPTRTAAPSPRAASSATTTSPLETLITGAGLPTADPPTVNPAQAFTTGNAAHVVELAGWGVGHDFDLSTISNGQIVSDGELLVTYERLSDIPDYPEAVRTRFWDLPSGNLRHEMLLPEGYEKLFVSPDGRYFATYHGICPNEAGEPCVLDVWHAPTEERVLSLELNFLEVAAFSSDNRWFALAVGEEIQVWDFAAGELAVSLPQSSFIDRMEFSNSGDLLAGYQQAGDQVRVWQVETGDLVSTVTSETYASAFYPSEIAFSPDDTQLAIGFNGVVGLWSTSDWGEGITWQGHNASITQAAFSPDGSVIASAAEDGTIALADPSNGVVLVNWGGHLSNIYGLSFSPNGSLLISTSLDGTLRFWGIPEE